MPLPEIGAKLCGHKTKIITMDIECQVELIQTDWQFNLNPRTAQRMPLLVRTGRTTLSTGTKRAFKSKRQAKRVAFASISMSSPAIGTESQAAGAWLEHAWITCGSATGSFTPVNNLTQVANVLPDAFKMVFGFYLLWQLLCGNCIVHALFQDQ